MPAPDLSTVPQFYHGYIRRVAASDAQAATSSHLEPLIEALHMLEEPDWDYAYGPGKWTIKELTQHILDAERIFCHRALSIARRDPNALPGFDEESYGQTSGADQRTGKSILQELKAVGQSTRCLFESFSEEQLAATGIANERPISVNAIAYIIAGHAQHHTMIINERYLNKAYQHSELA